MSKKYFPNDWQVVKDLPDEFFLEHEFEEVIEKAWSLIPGTVGIIRAENKKTGKVKEFVYKQTLSFQRKFMSLKDTHHCTFITDEVYGATFDPRTGRGID